MDRIPLRAVYAGVLRGPGRLVRYVSRLNGSQKEVHFMRRYYFITPVLIFIAPVLILALLCTFAACTARLEGGLPESGNTGAADSAPAAAAGALRLCDTQADGGYYLTEDRGAYGNLTYIDCESRRQAYLCARPECAHDSAACTSVITGNVLLFAANGQLYLIRVRTDEYGPPELISMAPDGSNRRKLAQFPVNYELDLRFYTDDAFLYLLADAVDGQTAVAQRLLLRVDLADGAWEEAYAFPPEFGMSFVAGTLGRRLIFALLESDAAGGGWTTAYRFLDVDAMAFDGNEYRIDSAHGSAWYGGRLYEVLYESDAVRVTDPATGETSEVSYAPLFTMPGCPAFRHDFVGVEEAADGILRLEARAEDAADEKSYVFLLDPDSGAIVPFTLFKTFKPEPVTVLAQWDDLLLVLADWKESPGSDAQIHNYIPQRALIQTSDYLASVPAYLPILSDVYPDAWA